VIATIAISADRPSAGRALAWLTATASEGGVPSAQVLRLDHCLDEALANVIACGDARALASPITVKLEVRREADRSIALVTVTDAGVAFNPLEALEGQGTRPKVLSAVEPGGLGLVMIRAFSDVLEYGYRDGCNHFTFAVSWALAE
jgi:serine/threonine-protein kinase RsbW